MCSRLFTATLLKVSACGFLVSQLTFNPVQVGPKPVDLAVGLGAVWVADQADDSIYTIDPVTKSVERIGVGSPLASVVVDVATQSLWVAVTGNPVPD